MRALIICPDPAAGFGLLGRQTPVALAPCLGESLLGHCLSALAEKGARHVTVLASDRPEMIYAHAGRGERWGVKVEVVPETRELGADEARRRYRPSGALGWLEIGADILVADRRSLSCSTFLGSGRRWFDAMVEWLPEAPAHRVGVREVAPRVWAGLRCKIEIGAQLSGPCWLGEGVWVRSGAKVGPFAFVEDRALIDHDAEVLESWIGPETYVGAMTHLSRSLAWGDGLLNWETGSFVEVADAFLLGSLEKAKPKSSCLGRTFAALSAPVTPLAWWRACCTRVASAIDRRSEAPGPKPLR